MVNDFRHNMRQAPALLVTLLTVISAFLMISCSDDTPAAKHSTTTHKIAVIMPAANQEEWSRTVNWALDNIGKAQTGLQQQFEIDITWHDEDDPMLDNYLRDLAHDESIEAVVGPMTSEHAKTAAKYLEDNDKLLILPVATSTEFQRLYAGRGNIWHLSQSDITQSEILLTQAKECGYLSVSLLTSDDDYGRSFSDWFAYQAIELGITPGDVITYTDEQTLRESINHFGGSGYRPMSMLLFAPSKERDAEVFDDQYGKLSQQTSAFRFPEVICSDMIHSPSLARKLKNCRYEGISPSASPSSGFLNAYMGKYGTAPVNGEAHLFDAISMLGYAFTARKENEGLADALQRVVRYDGAARGWLPDDMAMAYRDILAGGQPKLTGVTGDWTFDAKNRTNILNTTYTHWLLQDGEFITLEYLSTDGGDRTTSTIQIWEETTDILQDFDSTLGTPDYGEKRGNWAVVVGASDTWANYRHQADAMAMYQLLRRHGYDDNHIILILEDNLADDPRNIWPGEVRVHPDGENVRRDLKPDYKLSSLSVTDLENILLGRRSASLPEVLDSDSHDNVIFFWCGHGHVNQLMWGSRGEVAGDKLGSIVREMSNIGRFRKLFIVMDACYSGSIGEACEGIPGVLIMTAANSREPSKADVKSSEMGIWLSNGFTRAFQETIDTDSSISLRDLYYKVARRTLGSHATVYNAASYGNIFRESTSEYLK